VTRLRFAREARGLTQSQVIAELVKRADAAGMTIAAPTSLKALLSSFENGRRKVGEPYRALFRAIYGKPDAELFDPIEAEPATPDDEYQALAERVANARSVDRSTAELLSKHTDYLRTMDCRLGAAPLVDQMKAHLTMIEESLSHAILPSVRQPLAAVLADAAALAAWQALDVGSVNRAWQYHELARSAALEAHDLVLLTHAMAQQAYVLAEIGETASALDLVREAVREAGTAVPPRVCGWLLAAEAEIWAATGADYECKRTFDLAAATVPSDKSLIDPERPYIILNDAHLARWRGNSLARLGDPDALTELQRALDGKGVVSTHGEASLRCDLAHAFLLTGELDEARRQAREARRLARLAGSVRQRKRVERLALVG
jgi:transcriptional regulator with XRE-family HTH domain